MREHLQAQGAIVSIVEIEALWGRYLKSYVDPQIRGKLQRRWRDDPNVVRGRIQFEYPPTFQPGYIGSALMTDNTRILFIWQNPGEGSTFEEGDKPLAEKLNDFAKGKISLAQLSEFQARLVVTWPIYRGKGIFAETDDCRIALLPKAKRPSVRSVALLNVFPLKTTENDPPLVGALKQHMWGSLVMPTIEAIAPTIIVYHRLSNAYLCQLKQLKSVHRIVRVQHPAARNPSELKKNWRRLARLLPNAMCQPSASVMSGDVQFIGPGDRLPPGRPGQFIVIYERKLDECYGYSLADTPDEAERIFREFQYRPDVKRDPIRRGPNVGRPAPIVWINKWDGEEWVTIKETEGAQQEFYD